ncbi:MAG: hypothetical protein HAW59_03390 [Betaproteobacteria bacterium]|nr:hypothetical protein [Betaproteobacteria bacterium]
MGALVLSGCAVSRPDISREDWKIRSYEGIEKRDIMEAAREVIRLSDPDEIRFESKPDGFAAVRRQISYYVVESGVDIFLFEFTARETNAGVEARIDIQESIERAGFATLGLPITKVGRPENSYIYDLFYSRMEYLLGLKDRWHTCKDAVGKISTSGREAEELGLAAFCGRFASDLSPPPVSQKSGVFE